MISFKDGFILFFIILFAVAAGQMIADERADRKFKEMWDKEVNGNNKPPTNGGNGSNGTTDNAGTGPTTAG